MQFNFKLFSALATKAYKSVGSTYTLEQVLEVFRCYFENYEEFYGCAHPNIRLEQIERIISVMPFIDDAQSSVSDICPEAYPELIEQHFSTEYRDCDYNINHFFSGAIRELRFYEAGLD